ncbi:NADPH:quinone oxidoreductase family protein [Phytohabitans suffuscus]|uniref:NADPH:quinone oxidoreductase n=1 Tax=Phytohabitans suffuscus TaxID=624315 RepID=A0A6F8YXH7_9ACTN|nr:NADPH:quinone oxidoreductase family protein [Phytohabitans suffuscus]BCB90802.1 NADPH:quinone oxidoreductase [Phytohabitans suffuscus]
MRAARVTRLDGPAAIEVGDVPEPAGDGLVVVDVVAAGVTYPDALLTRGRYQVRPEPPFVLGCEVAGVVREAPPGSGLAAGDRVAAFPGLGGFAEVVAAEPDVVLPLPGTMSFEAGAALPMNYLTVHFGLVRRGGLHPGETVLVHGAAGGIGTAAIQLAKAYGARVVAVVSTEDKAAVARAAGADDTVPADGFLDEVRERTGGRGVDIVVDPVGGDRFTDSLRSLAPEGRLLVVGFTGGDIPTVKVNRLLLNNISVVGVGWGAFWHGRPRFLREQWTDLLPLLEAGRLDPPLGRVFALEDAAAAVTELDERRATGKILIKPART